MTNVLRISLNIIRSFHHRKVIKVDELIWKEKTTPVLWKKNAVRYGLIDYYPRHPDHKDPPITPSKILMVQKMKRFRGMEGKNRKIFEKLGIRDQGMAPVFVKNTPEMCAILWDIKHLIKVTPVILPKTLPSIDDLTGVYIHENGTFYHTPKIDVSRHEATEKFLSDPSKYDKETITEQLRIKWGRGF